MAGLSGLWFSRLFFTSVIFAPFILEVRFPEPSAAKPVSRSVGFEGLVVFARHRNEAFGTPMVDGWTLLLRVLMRLNVMCSRLIVLLC